MKTTFESGRDPVLIGPMWPFLLLGAGLGLAVVVSAGPVIALLMLLPLPLILIRFPPAIFLAWLAVLVLLPSSQAPPEFHWVSYRFFLPVLFLVMLALNQLRVRALPRITPAEWAMAAYLLWAILSIAWRAEDAAGSLARLFDRAFIPFMGYGLARLVGLRKSWARMFIPFLSCLIVVEVAIGVWSYWDSASLPAVWAGRHLLGRATGTLLNPNAYSVALLFCATFILNHLFFEKRVLVRRLLWILFSAVVASVFLTYSRASWLGFILFLVALMVFRFRRFVFFGLAVSLGGALVLSTVYTEGLRWATARIGNQKNVERRIVQIQASVFMFRERPVTGWGYGNYDKYDARFVRAFGDVTPIEYDFAQATSHNTFLTILAETGLVGFLLYLFPFAWWLGKSLVSLPRLSFERYLGRHLVFLLWLFVGFYFVVTQFMDMKSIPIGILLVWLGLGLIANLMQPPAGEGEFSGNSALGE